ncbi:MAG: metal-dependent transcriptional regulator [Thermodesulfobacteriota bacterium]|nr:metal-dependent transcriptional regulator [Thermodesulfobacteriota bacterium]
MDKTSNKTITSAMEDYLEVIYNLAREKRAVRVKDIAKRLGVKMPTVTSMLKGLNEKKLIDYEKYEYIELTEKGSNVGQEIDRRHQIFREFLTDILKIDYKQADEDACKMEHAVSPTTINAFVDIMEFINNCPRGGASWLEYFDEYRAGGQQKAKCIERMKEFAEEYNNKIKEMEKGEK